MTEWRVELPLTSPLSLNDRGRRMAQWRAQKRLKDAVTLLARNVHHIPPCDQISVELHWVPNVARNRDGDNPAPTIKAATDGLAAAGVISNDDTAHVRHLPVVIHPPVKARHGRLYLIVRAIEEAA
jgi:hypothetical protein